MASLGILEKNFWLIFVAIIYFIFPLFLPISVSAYIVLFGLCAIGYNILLGYTGYLSFGHALFWGLGAYGCGIYLAHPWVRLGFEANLFFAILMGLAFALIVGLIVGAISMLRRGVYFAMVSLAFNTIFFWIFFWARHITGGDDGLIGIHPPPIEVPNLFSIPLMGDDSMTYYFIIIVVISALFIVKRFVNSPFGLILQAIRENEDRVSLLGYNVFKYKLLAYVSAGVTSGLAGALFPIYQHYVGIENLHWLMSGDIVMMAVLGGITVFYGPLLGAFLYILLKEKILAYTAHWQFFVGTMFVVIVFWGRQGILGTLEPRIKKYFK